MPQQLTFDLAPPEAPALANFLAGDNAEALDALDHVARGALRESSVVLWGEAGAGKSHLLQAAVARATAAPRYARYYATPELAPAEPPELGALVAVDDVDRAGADAQANLFRLYLALGGTGGQLLVAMAGAPAACGLRADLRTRLGQGLVYEVRALRDAAKPAALARFAGSRGFTLPPDVIDYLLAHYPRDMGSLVRAVVALDRRSLAARRPITIPFVREALGDA